MYLADCKSMMACAVVAVAAASTPACAQARSFDVAAQPAPSAITAFGRQAEIQVIAPRRYTRGKLANAVKGTMTVEAAFRMLLKGTGLDAVETGPQTYMVKTRGEVSRLGGKPLLAPTAYAYAGDVAPPPPGGDPAEAAGDENEILVTARKRDEKVTDVPLSITAFSSRKLQESGVSDLEDISRQTPGMQFNNEMAGLRPGRSFSSIRFRGIQGSEFSTLQTASLFIDGVYVLQGAQSMQLMDLERVEVIKGPQAAQFGRNSFAGAINYITSNPNLSEFEGKIDAHADQRGGYELQASLEGPLIGDKLAMRVTARSYHRAAQFTASDGGDLGEQSSKAISATLFAAPTEGFTAKLRVFYQEDDDGPAAVAYLPGSSVGDCTRSYSGYDANDNPITFTPKSFICGSVGKMNSPGAPRVDANTSMQPSIFSLDRPGRTVNPNYIRDVFMAANPLSGVPDLDQFGLKRHMLRLSLATNYETEGGTTITATGAYNDNRTNDLRDFDMTANQAWYALNPQKARDWSVDLRIASPGDQPLRWMIGANYYDQKYRAGATGGVFLGTCFNFTGVGDSCDYGPGIFDTGLDGSDMAKTYGAYGSLSYDILQNLTLDFEARYQRDEHSDGSIVKAYNQFLPRVTLSYKPTPDLMLYANYALGRLPGVLNANINSCSSTAFTTPYTDPRTGAPSTASECDQLKAQLGDDYKPFTEQQKLTAYEAGLKASLLDNRVQLSLAGYWQKWTGQPFPRSITVYRESAVAGVPDTVPAFVTASGSGDSRYYGAELAISARPDRHWDIDFNLAYNHGEFTRLFGLEDVVTIQGTPNVKGNEPGRFPHWAGNFSVTYRQPVSDDWTAYARPDIIYQGRTYTGIENLAWLSDYVLVNMRIGIEGKGRRLELFAKNLFDQQVWSSAQTINDLSTPGDFNFSAKPGIMFLPQERRTFGLRASMDF